MFYSHISLWEQFSQSGNCWLTALINSEVMITTVQWIIMLIYVQN